MSNYLFTGLANWDGSLSQQQPSSSSPTSSVEKQSTNVHEDVFNTPQPVSGEEQRKQSATAVMPPPPLPRTPMRPTSHRTNQSSSYDRTNLRRDSWSAKSISSQSSFSNNAEDRSRVEGMLFESDDPSSPSGSQPEHHWQVPMDMLSPNTAGMSNSAWPSHSFTPPSSTAQWSQVMPPPVFENEQAFPPMDPFLGLSPPISVTPSPVTKKSTSPLTKDTSDNQEDLIQPEIPPSLSFSPSHYCISELPSVLDGDISVNPQSNVHQGVADEASGRPTFDSVEPLTRMSLLTSLEGTSAHSLSPEIPLITPVSAGHTNHQDTVTSKVLANTSDLSRGLGGATSGLADERSPSTEKRSDSTLGTVEPPQVPGTEPPTSISFTDRRSFDDGRSDKVTSSKNLVMDYPTPTPPSQRDMSVVPETPPTISPVSPQASHFAHAPKSDSPMRVSESYSPDSFKDPRPFVSRSTGESTLIDPSQQIIYKTRQEPGTSLVLRNTREESADQLDSSPLSSPPTSVKRLCSRPTVYIDVPPLPPHRRKEDYRPISSYVRYMSTSDLQPTREDSRSSGAGTSKRKRSVDVAKSPPAHAKRPRASTAKSTSPIVFSSWGEVGLESLGHDAYDALKPFCEYLEVDAGFDMESDIEERYTDVMELEKALKPVFRHLRALLFGAEETRQVVEEESERVDAAPLPGPASQIDDPQVPVERMVSVTLQTSPPQHHTHSSPGRTSQTTQPPAPPQIQSQQQYPCHHDETRKVDSTSHEVTFSSLLQDTTLIRDHDTFLGVQEDHPYDDNDVLTQSAADTLIDSYGPPSSSSRIYGSSLIDPAYDYGHEGAVFYSQDGTINPTLLAPPPILPHHFRTPSLSPQPSSPEMPLRASLSQVTTSVFDNEDSSCSSSSSSSEEEDDNGQKRKKSKDKGKERASDVGIRARQLLEEYEPGLRVVSQPRYETRDRRPTVKAMEAMETIEYEARDSSVSSYAESTQRVTKKKTKKEWKEGREKRKTMGNRDPTYAGEYCHQCRNTNRYAKMRCSAVREDGESCLLLFCEKCILKRYTQEIQFDLGLSDFVCPKCSGYCNCTHCARRRGEVYVSTKHVKLGLETRTRLKTRRKSKSKRTHSNSDSEYDDDDDGEVAYTEYGEGDEDSDSDIHIPIPSALPVGGHFGAIYDLSGRKRIGVGIVADASQRIVLVPNSHPGCTSACAPAPVLGSATSFNPALDLPAGYTRSRVNDIDKKTTLARNTRTKKTKKTKKKKEKAGRQFIGRPLPIWRVAATNSTNTVEGDEADEEDRDTGGRAYVGKRGPLFNGAAYPTVDELVRAFKDGHGGPRTPPRSELIGGGEGGEGGEGVVTSTQELEVGEGEGESSSKAQLELEGGFDPAGLSFTLAKLLGLGS